MIEAANKYDDGAKNTQSETWVHYWELSNYNNGTAIGRFFDLDGKSLEEHGTDIQNWLEDLSEMTGELCEEWILGDAEGVPSKYVNEYGISDEFFKLSELIEESGLSRKVFEAGIACGIDTNSIEDAFAGEYESDVYFALEMAEACGFEESNTWPQSCIDWNQAAYELMFDYSSDNGYYFSNNY
jgi:antirestriction protein